MSLVYRLGVPFRVQATCFRTLARLRVRVHPLDAELVARFSMKRGTFDMIRTLLCEDLHLTYVGHRYTRVAEEDRARPQEDPGISAERWDLYRQLMREIGVLAMSHVGDSITMRVSTCGSSSKGFVYSPTHRVVVSSLDQHPLPPVPHAHLILDELWYVYYGWGS